MKIGAQLYTVREFTQTENDFSRTIEKVAGIGYKYVQVSAIGPIPVETVAKICKANDICCVITHTNPVRIKEDTDAVINEHKIMGAGYVGIGAMPEEYRGSADGVNRFITDYKPASEKIKAAGLQFMYHNHDFEYEKFDGRLVFEYLIDCPTIGFTLDTYWVQAGGGDPCIWLRKLAGRVNVIHIKDMSWKDGGQRMSEIMEGNLNWTGIIEAAMASGVEYAMVEQDDCYGADPFECLRISYNNWTQTVK